jgi:hypothetical protein
MAGAGPPAQSREYIERVEVRDESMTHYELYVSRDRLTFILTQPGATGLGGLWVALLGGALYGRLARKKYGDGMSLDQKLAASKGSFVVQAAAIVSLAFGKVLGQYDLRMEFEGSGGGLESRRLTMSRQGYDALSGALKSLRGFASKLKD